MSSRKDRRYYHVFDYFERKGLLDFSGVSDEDLYFHYIGLLRGFIRQELKRIRDQENPQVHHLKKRFKNILKDEQFCHKTDAKKGHDKIYLCKYADNLRAENPPIPYDELYQLAERAFFDSNTRVRWCHKIFEQLNASKEYQNLVVRYELMSIVVSINAKHVELYGPRPSKMPSHLNTILQKSIDKARRKAIARLKQEIIPNFVAKGRINQDEAERFARAAELFLIDLGSDGWTDAIPEYFRAFMPEEKRKVYLKNYKYVFETITDKAKEFFLDDLRNDPTIGDFGDY